MAVVDTDEYLGLQTSFDLPEKNLWIAVLAALIKDIKYATSESKIKKILEECKSDWMETVCELIDIDYKFFIESVYAFANKKKEELRPQSLRG